MLTRPMNEHRTGTPSETSEPERGSSSVHMTYIYKQPMKSTDDIQKPLQFSKGKFSARCEARWRRRIIYMQQLHPARLAFERFLTSHLRFAAH